MSRFRAMGIKTYWSCPVLLWLFLAGTAEAQNCGWSKIDHELGFDESGIWKPSTSRTLMNGLTIAQSRRALGRYRLPARRDHVAGNQLADHWHRQCRGRKT